MFRVLGLLSLLVLALLSVSDTVAEDRDEFYAIARGEVGRRAAPAAMGWFGQRPAPTVQHLPADRPRQMNTRPNRQAAALSGTDGGSRAFCVRSCDGYFFPVGPVTAGAGRSAQAEACSAMCPGASVRLYSSRNGSIETARSDTGQHYTANANAFRFRERLVPGCSCQASITQGLARLSFAQDFTLRTGDVVVTEGGVRVFRGSGRFPHQPRDFVTARAYGRLTADMRRRVEEIETARLPERLLLAGIGPTTTSNTFARTSRLPELREMTLRGPVRQIAIERPAPPRMMRAPLPPRRS